MALAFIGAPTVCRGHSGHAIRLWLVGRQAVQMISIRASAANTSMQPEHHRSPIYSLTAEAPRRIASGGRRRTAAWAGICNVAPKIRRQGALSIGERMFVDLRKMLVIRPDRSPSRVSSSVAPWTGSCKVVTL